MLPLTNWNSYGRGYRFKQPTSYSSAHLGLDIMCPAWTPLYAPFPGISTQNNFTEGGNVIDYRCNGLVMRFIHLAKVAKTGPCSVGDIIGYTGNTGTLSTGAHLHCDISKGSVQIYNINNFLDPESFAWGEGAIMTPEQIAQMNGIRGDLNRWNKDRFDEIVGLGKRIDALITAVNSLGSVQGISVEDQAAVGVLKKFLNWIQSFWVK
jgi:murein DD-endopeptidase MepM/ murein hydrolase activator NlpD